MKMPFSYSSVPVAPSQSTGEACSHAKKSPAIFLRIQDEEPACIIRLGTEPAKSLVQASDIIRSFASNSLSLNALRSSTVEKNLKRLFCVRTRRWGAGFL